MGATAFATVSHGADARSAFRAAVDQAAWEHGPFGYTGTIAEKHDFALIATPARMTSAKLLRLLDELEDVASAEQEIEFEREFGTRRIRGGNAERDARKVAARRARLAKALPAGFSMRELEGAFSVYRDKWGPALAIELSGSELKRYRERHGLKGRRVRVFVFAGIASD